MLSRTLDEQVPRQIMQQPSLKPLQRQNTNGKILNIIQFREQKWSQITNFFLVKTANKTQSELGFYLFEKIIRTSKADDL